MAKNINGWNWMEQDNFVHPNNNFFEFQKTKNFDGLHFKKGEKHNQKVKELWENIVNFNETTDDAKLAICDTVVRLAMTSGKMLIIQFSDSFYGLSEDKKREIIDKLKPIIATHRNVYKSGSDLGQVRFVRPRWYTGADKNNDPLNQVVKTLGCDPNSEITNKDGSSIFWRKDDKWNTLYNQGAETVGELLGTNESGGNSSSQSGKNEPASGGNGGGSGDEHKPEDPEPNEGGDDTDKDDNAEKRAELVEKVAKEFYNHVTNGKKPKDFVNKDFWVELEDAKITTDDDISMFIDTVSVYLKAKALDHSLSTEERGKWGDVERKWDILTNKGQRKNLIDVIVYDFTYCLFQLSKGPNEAYALVKENYDLLDGCVDSAAELVHERLEQLEALASYDKNINIQHDLNDFNKAEYTQAKQEWAYVTGLEKRPKEQEGKTPPAPEAPPLPGSQPQPKPTVNQDTANEIAELFVAWNGIRKGASFTPAPFAVAKVVQQAHDRLATAYEKAKQTNNELDLNQAVEASLEKDAKNDRAKRRLLQAWRDWVVDYSPVAKRQQIAEEVANDFEKHLNKKGDPEGYELPEKQVAAYIGTGPKGAYREKELQYEVHNHFTNRRNTASDDEQDRWHNLGLAWYNRFLAEDEILDVQTDGEVFVAPRAENVLDQVTENAGNQGAGNAPANGGALHLYGTGYTNGNIDDVKPKEVILTAAVQKNGQKNVGGHDGNTENTPVIFTPDDLSERWNAPAVCQGIDKTLQGVVTEMSVTLDGLDEHGQQTMNSARVVNLNTSQEITLKNFRLKDIHVAEGKKPIIYVDAETIALEPDAAEAIKRLILQGHTVHALNADGSKSPTAFNKDTDLEPNGAFSQFVDNARVGHREAVANARSAGENGANPNAASRTGTRTSA